MNNLFLGVVFNFAGFNWLHSEHSTLLTLHLQSRSVALLAYTDCESLVHSLPLMGIKLYMGEGGGGGSAKIELDTLIFTNGKQCFKMQTLLHLMVGKLET